MRRKNLRNYIIFSVIVIIAGLAFGLMLYSGFKFFSGRQDLTPKVLKQPEKSCQKYRLLDGVCLGEGETEKYPLAIVIDNKIEARPLAGLSSAGFVYEAPVEGGITRFLAIYTTGKEIEKIGPIRSLRPYFIDWAVEFGTLLIHSGGSPESLELVQKEKNLKKLDLDEFSSGNYFWRDRSRLAPHNLYTSSVLLNSAMEKRFEKIKARFSPWLFKEDDFISERGEIKNIRINFGLISAYAARWEYDRDKNIYQRKINNGLTKDDDGNLILAKNIAVLKTDIFIIDSLSRRKIRTQGEGEAVIFQDGRKIEGRWEKKDRESRLRFYDRDGNEIKFNRGATWVEVVSDLGQVELKLN